MTATVLSERKAEAACSVVDQQLRARFIDAMGLNATSVNVITTAGKAGRFGLTVSAFNSVSADPPTLLICINSRSPACQAVLQNGQFAVNILNHGQTNISDTFAGRPSTGAAFDFLCCQWNEGGTGLPLVKDAVASFECALEVAHQVGSHTIFIGRVLAVENSDQKPLLYSRRTYVHLAVA